MTGAVTGTANGDFTRLSDRLTRHAAQLARHRAAERRAGDRLWRSARLLWPDMTQER